MLTGAPSRKIVWAVRFVEYPEPVATVRRIASARFGSLAAFVRISCSFSGFCGMMPTVTKYSGNSGEGHGSAARVAEQALGRQTILLLCRGGGAAAESRLPAAAGGESRGAHLAAGWCRSTS